MRMLSLALFLAFALPTGAEEEHYHPPPEKLGKVVFENSCSPQVAEAFNRSVALLHSFAYDASEHAFREVLAKDPGCSMAHWGIAMSYYHLLWEPNSERIRLGMQEVAAARKTPAATPREREYIEAIGAYYDNFDSVPHADRARAYETAMAAVAQHYPQDTEAQIFYALALLSTAAPTDSTHAHQKHAAEILEPLYARFPDHPGLAHYLIHAYDSSELAARGVKAARAYSQIAPSAPHALHMPSHVFTRLGLWDDSIASNRAARQAAHDQGDIGEELHAMDYLTYAYLQLGRFGDAERIVRESAAMKLPAAGEFKIGYATNAMPVRLAVEQGQWPVAAALQPAPGSSPQVAAIVYWARAVGNARAGTPQNAAGDIAKLDECKSKLVAAGNKYWARQAGILGQEAGAWVAFAGGDKKAAIASLRAAADDEDTVEKLPVTPGPIVPAREQLGEMLLAAGQPDVALREIQASLKSSPGRRGALLAESRAKEAVPRP